MHTQRANSILNSKAAANCRSYAARRKLQVYLYAIIFITHLCDCGIGCYGNKPRRRMVNRHQSEIRDCCVCLSVMCVFVFVFIAAGKLHQRRMRPRRFAQSLLALQTMDMTHTPRATTREGIVFVGGNLLTHPSWATTPHQPNWIIKSNRWSTPRSLPLLAQTTVEYCAMLNNVIC